MSLLKEDIQRLRCLYRDALPDVLLDLHKLSCTLEARCERLEARVNALEDTCAVLVRDVEDLEAGQ